MKIVFIEQESRLGGVEYTTLYLAQHLNRSQYQPVVICPEEGDLPERCRAAGIEVCIVPRPSFSSVSRIENGKYVASPVGIFQTAMSCWQTIGPIQAALRQLSPRLVITKGLLAHFYGGIAARRLSVPCVWHVQEEVSASRAGGWYRRVLNYSARYLPSFIIVDAAALLAQFNHSPEILNKTRVIYNGIDTGKFKPFSTPETRAAKARLELPESAFIIGQVGRITPIKGQQVLLDAFRQVAEKFPGCHLAFIGAPLFDNDNYQTELYSNISAHHLQSRVHFTGFLPDVRDGLAALDLFVHPSIETDSPLSIIEAMACGKPVVASAVEGTKELIVHQQNGWCVPPNEPVQLARVLEQLIQDPGLRDRLGAEARRHCESRFSIAHSAGQLEEVLHALV